MENSEEANKKAEKPRSIFDLYEFEQIDFNPFSFPGFNKYGFRIQFPSVAAGWFTIRLSTPKQKLEYQVSYCDGGADGLPGLLEASIDLLHGVGEYDKYFGKVRERTRFMHSSEVANYAWDLDNSTGPLRILIREIYSYDLEEELLDYPEEDWEWLIELEKENFDYLKESVLLAVSVDLNVYAISLYLACRKFLFEVGAEKYKEEWEGEFPFELVSRLEQYLLLDSTNHTRWGLWEYTDNDYSNRISGEFGPTLKVQGRRMLSDERLKEKGYL